MCRIMYSAVPKWSIAALILNYAALAEAQQPGTNLATPTQTTPGGEASPAMPQPVETGLAAEPFIPAESTRKRIPNVPMLLTGAVVLGASYGSSAIVAATSSRDADDKLYYPVAGPWMDLNRRGCDVNACSHENLDKALLIGDGVIQGIGALGVLLSFVVPEKITRHWYLIGERPVTVLPYASMGMTGIGAIGTF